MAAQPPGDVPQGYKDALPGKIAQPERVNFDEPPAKLLDRLYKQQTKHNYKKRQTANNCLGSLIRRGWRKCPYLKTCWINADPGKGSGIVTERLCQRCQ